MSWLVMLVSGLGVASAAGTAHALPLLTLSGSLRGLYGSALGDSDVGEADSLNPYGLGLGLRAGVTLPTSLYLGASFDYFFGDSEDVVESIAIYQLMANVGYDLGLGPLTLRPGLGFGVARSSVEIDGVLGSLETSESDFAISPGAEAIVGLGLLSVSAEARYNKVFADGDADAVILGVGVGFSL